MASYHIDVKVGGPNKAQGKAEYNLRESNVSQEKKDELVFSESINMPKWAQENPIEFWKASDRYERKNGSTYREHEVALPNELTLEENIELVREWVKNELEGKACTVAFHDKKAAFGNEKQLHAHIMFTDRKQDGIERDPDRFFKRVNSKNPEKGGCRKDNEPATFADRQEAIIGLRERWAEVQNKHLEMHGHDVRVDHRSYKERGIDRVPETHLGPIEVSLMTPDEVENLLNKREAADDLMHAQLDAKAAEREVSMLDLSGDISRALADRARADAEAQRVIEEAKQKNTQAAIEAKMAAAMAKVQGSFADKLRVEKAQADALEKLAQGAAAAEAKRAEQEAARAAELSERDRQSVLELNRAAEAQHEQERQERARERGPSMGR